MSLIRLGKRFLEPAGGSYTPPAYYDSNVGAVVQPKPVVAPDGSRPNFRVEPAPVPVYTPPTYFDSRTGTTVTPDPVFVPTSTTKPTVDRPRRPLPSKDAATIPLPATDPAPAEEPVNPIAKIYAELISGLQGTKADREQFYDDQALDLAERIITQTGLSKTALDNARDVLTGTPNPYTAMAVPTRTSLGNPMLAYLQATGVDPTQAMASAAFLEAENQMYNDAVARAMDKLGAAYTAADTSRLADLGLIEAGFASDLSGQENAILAALASQEASEIGELDRLIASAGLQQVSEAQGYDAAERAEQIGLFNSILGAYGGDLAPETVVEMVTKFATAIGAPVGDVMAGIA